MTLAGCTFRGFRRRQRAFWFKRRKIKGIGIDTLSVDYGLSVDFGVHHLVNRVGAYHIENTAESGTDSCLGRLVDRGANKN